MSRVPTLSPRPVGPARRALPLLVWSGLFSVLLTGLLLGPLPASAQLPWQDQGGWPAAGHCDTPSFAWQAHGPHATVTLLGSIHFAGPDLYPLCPVLARAFAGADALAVELDTQTRQAEVQEIMARTAFYPEGESLADNLDRDNLELMSRLGLNPDAYARFRPWFFAVLVQVQKMVELGYSPDLGLDVHFLNLARKRGLPVLELETAAQQMDLLREIAEDDTQEYVRQTLLELQDMDGLAGDIFAAWKAGDPEAMAKLIFAPLREHPEFAGIFERLYDRRNDGMAAHVLDYLAGDRNVFVVVGAGHLVGPHGVLAQLQAHGYALTQLGAQ